MQPKLRPGPNRPDPTPEPGRAEKGEGGPRHLTSLGTDRGPRLAQYWPLYRFASLYFLLVLMGRNPGVVTPARPRAAGGRRLPHLTVQRQACTALGGAAASLHPVFLGILHRPTFKRRPRVTPRACSGKHTRPTRGCSGKLAPNLPGAQRQACTYPGVQRQAYTRGGVPQQADTRLTPGGVRHHDVQAPK